MSENLRGDSHPENARPFSASVGIGLAIFAASVATFIATFAAGAIVGTKLSAAGGPMNEHHMGDGVMTGLIAGIICSLVVAVLLSRKLS